MYRISEIESWCNTQVELSDPGLWHRLISDFGEPLLHLLLDERLAETIPDDPLLAQFKKDVFKLPVRTFPLHAGSAWVLFAYGARIDKLPRPFFKHGFVLPLEWRRGSETGESRHSSLLPDELIVLADRVKTQLSQCDCEVADCYLYPAPEFCDLVDFHIENSGFESAWSSLAVALWSLQKGSRPFALWPFSSIAYDFEHDRVAPVAELSAKFQVASAMGAEEIAVAPQQVTEARRVLREIQRASDSESPVRNLRIFRLSRRDSLPVFLDALMRCNQVSAAVRHLRGWIANGVVLALAGALTGVWQWDAHREVIRNYSECEMRRCVPVGVEELSEDRLRKRHYHYEFHYRGRNGILGDRQVREVRLLDAEGSPTDMCFYRLTDHGISRRTFKYNADGTLSECFAYDAQGTLVRTEKYSNHSVDGLSVDHVYPIRKREFTWKALRACVRASLPTEVRHVKYRFDETGRLRSERYFTFVGTALDPCPDNSGAYGRAVTWQERDGGIEKMVKFLGKDGKPAASLRGAWGLHEFFDDKGLLRERRPIDAQGADCVDCHGVASVVFAYDGDLNLAEVSKRGKDGLFAEDDAGCARYLFDYLAGEVVTSRFVRADGCLRNNATNAVAMIVRKIERHGITNVIATVVKDAAGNLLPPGVFATDDKGNGLPFFQSAEAHEIRTSSISIGNRECTVKQEHNDAFGRLMETRDGIASAVMSYDDRGRRCRVETFSTNGFHKCSPEGFAICETGYSDDGRITTNRYFDADGKPCNRMDLGAHCLIVEQVSSRERIESYYDTSGAPVSTKSSDAPVVRYILNDFGLPNDMRYFDGHGKPALGRAGWHRSVLEYSCQGDFTGCKLFGVKDEPVVGYLGTGCEGERFHELRLTRDVAGNLRVLEYRDAEGALLAQDNGVARWEYFYQADSNQLSERRSFDAQGNPCADGVDGPVRVEYETCTNGVFIKRERYMSGKYKLSHFQGGENGRPVRVEFHRSNGCLGTDENGVSVIKFEYDARGHERRRLFFDDKEKPVMAVDSGIAGWETAYDERGNVLCRTCLGLDARPHRNIAGIVSIRFQYDAKGRETAQRFLDENERSTADRTGVAAILTRYEDQADGSSTEMRLYNTNNRLVNGSGGYAIQCKRKFCADDGSQCEELSFFNEREMPVAEKVSGFARVVSRINESGQVTNQFCYAENETLRLRHEVRYDWANRIVYQRDECQDAVGEKILLRREADGSSVYRYWGAYALKNVSGCVGAFDVTYDANGEQICLTFLDLNGNRVTNSLGVAEVKCSYDERRELTEQSYWNASNEMVAPNGTVVARMTQQYQYGHDGVRQTTRFYDKENFLVCPPECGKSAVIEAYWNADNLLTGMRFRNAERKPAANRHYLTGAVPVSELKIEWDESGRLREFSGFNDLEVASSACDRKPVIHVSARFDGLRSEYLLFNVKEGMPEKSPYSRIASAELERKLTRKVRWR